MLYLQVLNQLFSLRYSYSLVQLLSPAVFETAPPAVQPASGSSSVQDIPTSHLPVACSKLLWAATCLCNSFSRWVRLRGEH